MFQTGAFVKSNTKSDPDLGLNSNNAYVLPSDATLKEADAVLQRVIDNGGLREESSQMLNGKIPIKGKTGGLPSLLADGQARAQTVLEGTGILVGGQKMTASIHGHLTDIWENGGLHYPFSALTPSPGADGDYPVFRNYHTNIIVGKFGTNFGVDPDNNALDVRTTGAVFYNRSGVERLRLSRKALQSIINQ